MTLETTEKYIGFAFEKLTVVVNGRDYCKTPTTIFLTFEIKHSYTIDKIREEKSPADIDAIYEHIMKSKVLKDGKNWLKRS